MVSVAVLSALALSVTQVIGYNATCSDNLVVYWGQNSYGATNPNDTANWQQTISNYCQICSTASGAFPGTNLADCQFLAAGIEACQAMGKLVTISLGGQNSSTLSSDAEGIAFATTIWNLFLGGSSSTRPFGSVVLDGVDLDIEVGAPTGYAAFANQIRALSAGASKRYYITAAPQCPFPDAHIGSALNAARFDAVYVQKLNALLTCPIIESGVTDADNPEDWDFSTWDKWATTVSPNPDVKVFIGAPASPNGNASYVNATTLGAIALQTRAEFTSFGGIMLWDASQAYANERFDIQIKNIIAADGCSADTGGSPPPTCAQTYTVVSQDTCSIIESKTGLNDTQLRALNPGINDDCTNLQIGQTLCVTGASGGTSPPSSGCAQNYTVVSGDTCSIIEKKTGLNDTQLRELNPEINDDCTNLQLGETLCVNDGSGGTSPPSSGCAQNYTVVSGDTCSIIESKTGLNDTQLRALNPEINDDCTNLQLGEILCVNDGSGGTSPPSDCTQNYTVVSGDTCSIIETKTGLNDTQLRELNPEINDDCTNLQLGEILCVNDGTGGTSPPSDCTQNYTVVSGDTCSIIETKTGLNDTQLRELNPEINDDCTNLQLGETLCVNDGSGGTSPPSSGCAQNYTVVSGDTCSIIEKKTDLNDTQLRELNPEINDDCTNLQLGEILCVNDGNGGTSPPSGGCAQTYTVVGGDSCFVIETKTGLNDTQLHALNPGINSDCTNLQVGEILCINAGTETATSSSTTCTATSSPSSTTYTATGSPSSTTYTETGSPSSTAYTETSPSSTAYTEPRSLSSTTHTETYSPSSSQALASPMPGIEGGFASKSLHRFGGPGPQSAQCAAEDNRSGVLMRSVSGSIDTYPATLLQISY
ncbi:glycoside hydrolase superfamily [Mycena sanguinolenta]|nr:glycoside hydrolase superfamily [Mycena sanguinolenta]